MCQFWWKSVQNSSQTLQSTLGSHSVEQNKATQRFIPHTTHIPQSSSSSTHTEEKWLPSPSKLCVPCLPEPPPPSCGSRCLLQKTSPPHSHQEHSCPLPSKQLIPSFLPCAGSSQTHLSAAVWVVMGKERRAELGCCCCHCWKPWWAEASALSRGCPSSSSSHSALLFPAVAETKLSWSVSKTLGYMEADLMQATSLDHASLTSWKEKNKKHNFSPLILGPAVLPVYSKTQRMTAESGSQFWPLWKW